MSVPAVLIRKSTKQIIKHADYPKADLTPFTVGEIDPDYEWLIKHIPFAEPDHDSRIYIMEDVMPDLNFLVDFQEHPSYPGIREYRMTFNPIKRPNESIILEIENAEKQANGLIFSEVVHVKEFALMMNSIYKDANNLTLNADEQAKIDRLSVVNVKFLQNQDTKNIKIQQVTDGLEPNIDEGWLNE